MNSALFSRASDEDYKIHPNNKSNFLLLFGLRSREDTFPDAVKPKTDAGNINLTKLLEETFKYSLNKKKLAKKSRKAKRGILKKTTKTMCNEKLLLKLIKTTPFSITSEYGLQLCRSFGSISQDEIKELQQNADKHCGLEMSHEEDNEEPLARDKKFGTVLKLKKKKPDDDQSVTPNNHKYCFTDRDRVERDTEIIIGIASSSYKQLNKCRKLSVTIEKMTPVMIMKHQFPWEFLFIANKWPVENILRPKILLEKVDDPIKTTKTKPRRRTYKCKSSKENSCFSLTHNTYH